MTFRLSLFYECFLGLPCNCPSTYEPVCTVNGRILSNPCLARCMGYSDTSYAAGNCASRNPCNAHSCPTGSKCIPERKTCLSLSTECPQHRCGELFHSPPSHRILP